MTRREERVDALISVCFDKGRVWVEQALELCDYPLGSERVSALVSQCVEVLDDKRAIWIAEIGGRTLTEAEVDALILGHLKRHAEEFSAVDLIAAENVATIGASKQCIELLLLPLLDAGLWDGAGRVTKLLGRDLTTVERDQVFSKSRKDFDKTLREALQSASTEEIIQAHIEVNLRNGMPFVPKLLLKLLDVKLTVNQLERMLSLEIQNGLIHKARETAQELGRELTENEIGLLSGALSSW